MDAGLTIAFITKEKNGDSYTNFKKFGNKFWDDSKENKSRKGYYFAYYYRMEKVLIYRVEQILPPEQRPVEMVDWDRGRNVQCFGDLLREFTWKEWIEDYGKGAPYTPKYCSSQTTAWSSSTLRTKFPSFAYDRLIQELDKPTIPKALDPIIDQVVEPKEPFHEPKEPFHLQKELSDIKKDLAELKNSIKDLTELTKAWIHLSEA